jgi:hypothetical protein
VETLLVCRAQRGLDGVGISAQQWQHPGVKDVGDAIAHEPGLRGLDRQ